MWEDQHHTKTDRSKMLSFSFFPEEMCVGIVSLSSKKC